jgi:predicted permease
MSNLTFSYNTLPNWPTNWRGGLASVVGRLAVARPVAEAQLTAMLRRVYTGNDPAMRRADVSLRPVSYNMDGVEPPEIGVARLLGGVGLVMLLVAAANVTNLGLARAIRRRRELSVRVALGAGRWRIVRLMVVESVAIALVAGALGLVIAHWGGQIIRRALLPNVAWSELPVDGRVLVWTAALTLITGVIVGLVPALRVSKGDVAAALRGGRTGAGSAGESHGAVRAALQVVQLALSLVLLFAAGLFVRSLVDIQQLDLGYDRDRVLSIDIAFPQRDSATKEDLARDVAAAEERYTDLRTRFEHLPGVAGASVAFGNPLSAVIILSIRAPGIDSLDPTRGGRPLVTAAAPGYFATVGTRILRGRPFAAGEGSGSEPVVIVNQTMAQSIWPNEDALGRCIVFGTAQSPCARVIGIAQDVHQMSLKEPALSQCYIPWGQDRRFIPGSDLLVRARDDAKALIPSIKEVLRRGAQGMQSAEIRTLEEKLDPQVRPWRVGATLFGLFGMTVVVVAVVGLFSVVSYLVTQRTHEIGIRIALGARRGHVLRLVMGNGLRTAAIGILVGGTLSTALAPLLQPLLFDNRARDPLLLGGIGVGLIIVAAAASFWPSWRATRLDPMLALRAD